MITGRTEVVYSTKSNRDAGETDFCRCFDAIGVQYVLTLGKGFDPSQTYDNLYFLVRRTVLPGAPVQSPWEPAYDPNAQAFKVENGVIKVGSTVTNVLTLGPEVNACASTGAATDIWDFAGEANLYYYDQNVNPDPIVGYVSAIKGQIIVEGFDQNCPGKTNTLVMQVTVNYGPREEDCENCGSEATSCPIGSGRPTTSSVDYRLNLGKDSYGNFGNRLILKSDAPGTKLSAPGTLSVVMSRDCERIDTSTSYATGVPRQIRTPFALADIVVSNDYQYHVFFYETNNVSPAKTNGLWVPTGSAFRMVTIENPDGSTASNRLFISEIQGTSTNQFKYTWDNVNQWTLEYPDGLGKETLSRTWNGSNTERTEVKSIRSTNDTVIFQEQKLYRKYDFGEKLVEHVIDPSGAKLTNTWEYYTNGNKGTYTQLKQITRPGGYWERYEYDENYRITNVVSAYLNSTNGAPADQARQRITSYSANSLIVTNIEKVLGQEIGRSYTFYSTDETCEIQCQTPGATTNAADNLVTVTKKYPSSDAFKGELKSIKNPDGTMSFYSYSTNNYQKTTTVSTGQTNGAGDGILEGTKTVTVVGYQGEMISRTVYDITNGVDGITLSSETYSYPGTDTFKLSPRVTFLDGTSNQVNHGCCTIENSVDRDGTVTYFSYDTLKRRTATARNSITNSVLLDPAGNTLKNIRYGSDASSITTSQFAYDAAGRVTKETNGLGGVTTTTYFYDSSGQLIKTNTYPDGGLRIETYYMDGKLKSITGSATYPSRFEYGVAPDSSIQRRFTKEIKLDASAADTSETTTNYTDAVGRNYKTTFAAASSPWPYRESFFNNVGQLVRERDPDGVTTLYAYDAEGERDTTAISTNQDSSINYSGDRITKTISDVTTIDSVNIARTRTYQWFTNGSAISNLVAETRSSTDGRRNWDIRFGLTNQTALHYPGGGYTVITNTAPDGSFTIRTNYQGQLLSVTRKDAIGNQLSRTTFTYDSHGRVRYETDARNGTTTTYFNDADLISSVTTPAPGTGEAAQTTVFYYDKIGRMTNSVLPDGGSVTNEYSVNGLVRKSSGARTYPAAYSYDSQGRLQTMTNWTGYSSGTGARVTTWKYDAYRGFLTNKLYAGSNGPFYTYSAAGRLNSRLWARGITTTYTNSLTGDLVGIGYSDGTTPNVTYTVDRHGRPTTVAFGTNMATLLYNEAGQLLSESVDVVTLTNVYDALLRRTSVAVRSNATTLFTHNYAWDAASRLTNVNDGTYSAVYAYVANSPLVSSIAFKDGGSTRMTTTKQYDLLNRLKSISSQPSGSGERPVGFTYRHNDANQRTKRDDSDGTFWSYGYDSLGQATSGKRYWGDWTPVAGQQFEYAYDDIGNRTSTKAGGDSMGAGLRTANYTVNSLNQYTSRDVPGAADIIGISHAQATNTVNTESPYRRGEYFHREVSINNISAPQYPSITNLAWLMGVTNTNTGSIFLPKTAETFVYDADGNLTNDGRWTLSWTPRTG